MWTISPSTSARPVTPARLIGILVSAPIMVGTDPQRTTGRRTPPSTWKISASFALHNRAARSATVFSTGCRSVGELAITRSTSAVAACCSRLSARRFSRSRAPEAGRLALTLAFAGLAPRRIGLTLRELVRIMHEQAPTLTPALSLAEGEGVTLVPSPPEGERVRVRGSVGRRVHVHE